MTAASNAHGIVAADQPRGPSGFKNFYREFKEQIESIHVDVKDVVSQDDMECGLVEVTARHRGTGKNVKFSGLCMVSSRGWENRSGMETL